MVKNLVGCDLISHGIIGEETGFNDLRVGDIINVKGDNCIIVKYYSFYSALGYLSIPLEELNKYSINTDFKKVYDYTEITEDNIKAISGFKLFIKDISEDGRIPITKEEAELFMRRKIKIID